MDGPLPVSTLAYATPLADAWIKAGWENGYPNVDVNGKSQKGKKSDVEKAKMVYLPLFYTRYYFCGIKKNLPIKIRACIFLHVA